MSKRRRGNDDPVSLFSFQDIITTLSGVLILLVLIMAIQVAAQKSATAKSAPEESNDPLTAHVDKLEDDLGKVREIIAATKADPVQVARDLVARELELKSRESNHVAAERELFVLKEQLKRKSSHLSAASQNAARIAAELERVIAYNADIRVRNNVYFIPEVGIQKKPVLIECSESGLKCGVLGDPANVLKIAAGSDLQGGLRGYLRGLSKEKHHIVFLVKPSGVSGYDETSPVVRDAGFDMGSEPIGESIEVEYGVL